MNNYSKQLTVVVSVLLMLLTGCDPHESNSENVKAETSETSGSTSNASSVGDGAVTRADFESFLKFKRVSPEDKTRSDSLLDQYLERESLAASIEKEGLLDKAMLDTELNEFRKEMLISRYFQTFLSDKASDIEVRNFYETNAANYQQRRAKVAHILFRTNSQTDDSEREVKLTQAREVISRVNAGEDFALLAKEFSEDKVSSAKGGDIGWINQGGIDPRFSEVVFSMEKGSISEPVITPFGYHVIKLTDGPAVVTQPFEAVKGDIRYQLRNQAKDAELSRLKSLSKIELSE